MNRKEIFVFGSNLSGRHGKGAALYARQFYGAIYGQGIGLQGDSYALPTKDEKLKSLSLEVIETHLHDFVIFATNSESMLFLLTPIGTGLAGYNKTQIGRILRKIGIPRNVVLTREWITV